MKTLMVVLNFEIKRFFNRYTLYLFLFLLLVLVMFGHDGLTDYKRLEKGVEKGGQAK
jgi:cell division protein FtsB